MIAVPFLTQLDTRAAVKGSRDPLGIQGIWLRLGRHVVGNLTTVSNSVRDFTVLLLGHYFAERLGEEGGGDGDLSTFLKWEQLAGYARARFNKEDGFRGVERVKERLDGDHVRLGTDGEAQILGNQKIYGLWGLYTIPAKASGLLAGDPTRLTLEARAVLEKSLLPAMASAAPHAVEQVVQRLKGKECRLDVRESSRDAPLLRSVAHVLKATRAPERELYREHLLHGGPGDRAAGRGTEGKQRVLAELLGETVHLDDWELTPAAVSDLAARAERRGEIGAQLARRLERIRTAESALAPAAALFEHALGCDGQPLEQIAAGVQKHWRERLRRTIDIEALQAIEPELRNASGEAESGRRWLELARALHEARYGDALKLSLEQNAVVMQARNGAPWASLRDGKLHVTLRDDDLGRLPEASALPSYWRHAYFIESLRRVAGALQDK